MKNGFTNEYKEEIKDEERILPEKLNTFVEEIREWSENQIKLSEESSTQLTQYIEKKCAPIEKEEKFKKEAVVIKEQYNHERKTLFNRIARMIGEFGKFAGTSVVTFSLFVHFCRQEYPDRLTYNAQPEEVTWNVETKTELEKLSKDYVNTYKWENRELVKECNISDNELEDRFNTFVSDYMPNVQIITFKNLDEATSKFEMLIGEYILGRKDNEAFYRNEKIYYQKTERSNDTENFIAELSHHINKDANYRRKAEYLKDLIDVGLEQIETYKDLSSVEFQAHSITEPAIIRYLFAGKEDWDTPFSEIYNVYHEYSKALIEICENNYSPEFFKIIHQSVISEMSDYALDGFKTIQDVINNKNLAISNLKLINNEINITCKNFNTSQKEEVFDNTAPSMLGENDQSKIKDKILFIKNSIELGGVE